MIIEGSPDGSETPDPQPEIAAQIRESLSAWAVPFADETAARSFFASKGFDPVVWTGGLEQRDDGSGHALRSTYWSRAWPASDRATTGLSGSASNAPRWSSSVSTAVPRRTWRRDGRAAGVRGAGDDYQRWA